MADLRYTKSHEWCSIDGGIATVGITKHAAEQLNDLTFLDYRVAKGAAVKAGQVFGEIDSVKSTSDLYCPVSGTIDALNDRFSNTDELAVITRAPESEGWMIKIKVSDASEAQKLLSAADYAKHCADGAH